MEHENPTAQSREAKKYDHGSCVAQNQDGGDQQQTYLKLKDMEELKLVTF
jgi:hypothetical protein